MPDLSQRENKKVPQPRNDHAGRDCHTCREHAAAHLTLRASCYPDGYRQDKQVRSCTQCSSALSQESCENRPGQKLTPQGNEVRRCRLRPMQASYCEQIHHVTQTRESRFGLHFRKATRGIRAPSVVGIRLAPAFTLSGKLSAALRLSYVFDFVFRLQQASFRFDTHMSVHMPRQQPLQQGRFTQMVIPEAAAEVMNCPTGTLGPIMCQGLRVYVEAHTLLRNTTGQTRRPAENSRRGSHDCNCPVFPAYWPSSGFDSPAVLCSERSEHSVLLHAEGAWRAPDNLKVGLSISGCNLRLAEAMSKRADAETASHSLLGEPLQRGPAGPRRLRSPEA